MKTSLTREKLISIMHEELQRQDRGGGALIYDFLEDEKLGIDGDLHLGELVDVVIKELENK